MDRGQCRRVARRGLFEPVVHTDRFRWRGQRRQHRGCERRLLGQSDPLRRAGQARLADVDRLKAQLDGRGSGLEPKVEPAGVDELRIGHQAVAVHSLRPPIRKVAVVEPQRLPIGAPEEVVVPFRAVVGPAAVGVEQISLRQIDDVPLENCGGFFLPAPSPNGLPGAQREDVVPDDVSVTSRVHDPAGQRVVDDVVLDQQRIAALIEVDAPSHGRTAHVREHVVNNVAPDHRADLRAQVVDAARVAEHAADHVMNVVVLDSVVAGAVGSVVPVPSDRHAGVVEAVNLVVRDFIVTALGQPDADCPRVDAAAVVDVVVRDEIAACFGDVRGGHLGLPDSHTAGTQIVNVVLDNLVVFAATTQPDPVTADVSDFTLLQRTVSSSAR